MRGQAEAIDWGGEGETEDGKSLVVVYRSGWRHLLAYLPLLHPLRQHSVLLS